MLPRSSSSASRISSRHIQNNASLSTNFVKRAGSLQVSNNNKSITGAIQTNTFISQCRPRTSSLKQPFLFQSAINASQQRSFGSTRLLRAEEEEEEGHNEEGSRDLSFLSETKFKDLKLHRKLLSNLKANGYEYMTKIQAATVPKIMEGFDVLGEAKTGSGKTLAFGIPMIQRLLEAKMQRSDGVGGIIIAPTRELALQIFKNISELCRYTGLSCTFAIGGNNIGREIQKLQQSGNILVATPGRLLDHLTNDEVSKRITEKLSMVVIDEADRIMDIGFEETMNDIFDVLPKTQTLLFSATLDTGKVGNLQKRIINEDAHRMSVDTGVIPRLTQEYVVVHGTDRVGMLAKMLKENRHKKVVVFFSTIKSVDFHSELIKSLRLGARVYTLHGGKSQTTRTNIFFDFSSASKGILLTTDVAARGLDIPNVDMIIQYNPPAEIPSYFHRVGRTARAGSKGHAVLFLRPTEIKYLETLVEEAKEEAQVSLKELDFDPEPVKELSGKLKQYVEDNVTMQDSARAALKAFLSSHTQTMKHFGRNPEFKYEEVGEEFFGTVERRDLVRLGLDKKNNNFNSRGPRGGFRSRGSSFGRGRRDFSFRRGEREDRGFGGRRFGDRYGSGRSMNRDERPSRRGFGDREGREDRGSKQRDTLQDFMNMFD